MEKTLFFEKNNLAWLCGTMVAVLIFLRVDDYFRKRGKERLVDKFLLFCLFATLFLFVVVPSFYDKDALTFLLFLIFGIPAAIVLTIICYLIYLILYWLFKKEYDLLPPREILDALKEMGIRRFFRWLFLWEGK